MADNGFKLTAQLYLQAPTPANVTAVTSELRKSLQDVSVNVNARGSQTYTKEVTKMAAATTGLERSISKADTSMFKFGYQVGLAAKRFVAFTISTAGLIGLMRAFSAGIGDAVRFQNEMVKIAQVSGKVASGIQGLADEVTRLSTSLGTQSDKLLEAAQILVQAGLSVDDTKTSLEALAKASISPTFDDIIDTTEGAVAIFSQFKIGAEELEEALSSINAVAGKFAVESSDIITAVRRTGGAFKAAGGTLNELSALFTSVRATTRESAESISTGFRTIFTRLQRSRTIEFLDKLGIKLRDTQNQFVGPYRAIEQLSDALSQIPKTDPRFAQIIEELGGFRQISKVIPLITEFKEAQKALTVAQLGQNSLTIDAAKAQESFSVQLTKVSERFDELIRKFSNTESFRKTMQIVIAMTNTFIDLVAAIEPIIPLVGLLATAKLVRASKTYVPGIKRGVRGESLKDADIPGILSQFFADGGKVEDDGFRIPALERGSDKIPAMLTKGEFVIKRETAEKIGYGRLSRLNNFGYFADGGSTVRYEDGYEDSAKKYDSLVNNIIEKFFKVFGAKLDKESIVFKSLEGKYNGLFQHKTKDVIIDTLNIENGNLSDDIISKITDVITHELAHSVDYKFNLNQDEGIAKILSSGNHDTKAIAEKLRKRAPESVANYEASTGKSVEEYLDAPHELFANYAASILTGRATFGDYDASSLTGDLVSEVRKKILPQKRRSMLVRGKSNRPRPVSLDEEPYYLNRKITERESLPPIDLVDMQSSVLQLGKELTLSLGKITGPILDEARSMRTFSKIGISSEKFKVGTQRTTPISFTRDYNPPVRWHEEKHTWYDTKTRKKIDSEDALRRLNEYRKATMLDYDLDVDSPFKESLSPSELGFTLDKSGRPRRGGKFLPKSDEVEILYLLKKQRERDDIALRLKVPGQEISYDTLAPETPRIPATPPIGMVIPPPRPLSNLDDNVRRALYFQSSGNNEKNFVPPKKRQTIMEKLYSDSYGYNSKEDKLDIPGKLLLAGALTQFLSNMGKLEGSFKELASSVTQATTVFFTLNSLGAEIRGIYFNKDKLDAYRAAIPESKTLKIAQEKRVGRAVKLEDVARRRSDVTSTVGDIFAAGRKEIDEFDLKNGPNLANTRAVETRTSRAALAALEERERATQILLNRQGISDEDKKRGQETLSYISQSKSRAQSILDINRRKTGYEVRIERLRGEHASLVAGGDPFRAEDVYNRIQNLYKILNGLEADKAKVYGEIAENARRDELLLKRAQARVEKRTGKVGATASLINKMQTAINFSNFAEKVSPIIDAAAAVGITGGAKLYEAGSKQIAAGNFSGRDKVVYGGTLQGASTGVEVGTQLGSALGPYGMLAGAAIGGLVGGIVGYTSAIETAANQVRQVQFDQIFKDVSKKLNSIVSGEDSLFGNLGLALNNFNQSYKLFLASSGDTRQNLKGDLASLSVSLDTIFTSAIEKANIQTITEFKKVFGRDTLEQYAGVTGQLVTSVERDIQKRLDKNKDKKAKEEEFRRNQKPLDDYYTSLDNLNNTFNEFTEGLDNTIRSVESLTNSTITFREVAADVSKLSPQSFMRSIATARRTASFTGEFGQSIVRRSESAYEASKVLPQVLRQALSSGGLDGNGLDFAIVDYFKNSGFDEQVVGAISATVRELIGADFKPQNLAAKLIDDFNGTVEEFRKGLTPLDSGRVLLSNLSSKGLQIQQSLFQRRTDSENKALEYTNRNVENRRNIALQVAEVSGASTGSITDSYNAEIIRNMLGGSNMSISQIRDRLLVANQFIGANENQVASGEASLELGQAVQSEIALRDTLLKVLEKYTDASQTAATAQENLTNKLNGIKIRNSLRDTNIFGTMQEKLEQQRAIENVRTVARTGNIGYVADQDRRGVEQFLKNLGNTALPEITGGLSGNQVIRNLRYRDAYNEATSMGISGQGAAAYAASQADAAAQPEIQQAMVEALRTSTEANNALGEFYRNTANTANEQLNNILRDFTDNLRDIFDRQEREAKARSIGDVNAQLFGVLEKRKTFTNVQAIINRQAGRNTASEEGVAQLFKDAGQLKLDIQTSSRLTGALTRDYQEIFKDVHFGLIQRDMNLSRATGAAGGGAAGTFDPRISVQEYSRILGNISQFVEEKYGSDFRKDVMAALSTNEQLRVRGNQVNVGGLDSILAGIIDETRTIYLKNITDAQQNISNTASKFGITRGDLEALLNSKYMEDFMKAFEGGTVSFSELNKEVQSLTQRLQQLNSQVTPTNTPIRRRSGGFVPGLGNGDIVNARLEPGEYVLNRNAVRNIGVPALDTLNSTFSRFQTGGLVGRKINTIADATSYIRKYAEEELGIAPEEQVKKLSGILSGGFNYMSAEDAVYWRRTAGYVPKAYFDPGKKAIFMQKNADISSDTIAHEFAHAVDLHFGKNGQYASDISGTKISDFTQGFKPFYDRTIQERAVKLGIEGKSKEEIDSYIGSRANNYEAFATFVKETPAGKKFMRELFNGETENNSNNEPSDFSENVRKFSSAASSLATAMNNFPRELTLTANHRVEIILNGAQVLQTLMPEISKLIVEQTKSQFNSMLKIKFPTLGQLP